MKAIIGEFFAEAADGTPLVNGMNLFSNELEDLKTKIKIIGKHPDSSPLVQYRGAVYPLDLCRIKLEDRSYFYYGQVEVRMCYYFFYKFNEKDLETIKNESKIVDYGIPNYPSLPPRKTE
ncbi:MAG: hypothetical protein LBT20_04885 [Clostridiales bacterium]|jgi:hypothetical protein|nr:hypothetical protein [Clostridiales bacterium]